MKRHLLLPVLALFAGSTTIASGQDAAQTPVSNAAASISAVHLIALQCVPYARTVSGIQIYGDAHTWWGQAAGKYARGDRPKVGAVMAFKPHGRMELGHVAAVSKIIDSRTVLLRHANWSLINGARGQIENDVRAIDVSDNNDWSKVRVWFAPIQGIGGTAWPVQGFIYNEKPGKRNLLLTPESQTSARIAVASAPRGSVAKSAAARSTPDKARATREPKLDARYAADPIGAIIAASLR
ncbi:MAG: CHAP domain-containing protein [Novosphingobium sp.]